MCGCEPGFTCSRCAGTPDDDARPETERRSPWDDYPAGIPAPDGYEPPEPWLA